MIDSDKELLWLAAKAAGIDVTTDNNIKSNNFWILEDGEATCFWNPLTSDGDALRLAVKLMLPQQDGFSEDMFHACDERDPYAATRRAIVRAAADIGKGKP